MNLNADQQAAVAEIEAGTSVFLTGDAGTGKTFTLNHYLEGGRKRVAVTASTGIAATHLGGVTVHSWSGFGIGEEPPEQIARQRWWQFARQPLIVNTDIIVIDEISMLDGRTFAGISKLCQIARKKPQPFGGLQVVLVGDMGQLAPVDEETKGFPFETRTWWELGIKTVALRQVMRQKDALFARVLSQVRDGTLDREGFAVLESRVKAFDPDKRAAVRLTTHNALVDRVNIDKLAQLPGKAVQLKAHEHGEAKHINTLDKNCLSPRFLDLKPQARVMFTKNNMAAGYCNGTLGTVEKVDKEVVTVRIDGTKEAIQVERAEWKIKGPPVDKRTGELSVIARRAQFPLRLAWAITVHKSQGMTLDTVSVDLKNCFAAGQAYVALSRARSLEGLNIEAWGGAASIKAHPVVADFMAGRYKLPPSEGEDEPTVPDVQPTPPPPPPVKSIQQEADEDQVAYLESVGGVVAPPPPPPGPFFLPTLMREPGEPF